MFYLLAKFLSVAIFVVNLTYKKYPVLHVVVTKLQLHGYTFGMHNCGEHSEHYFLNANGTRH